MGGESFLTPPMRQKLYVILAPQRDWNMSRNSSLSLVAYKNMVRFPRSVPMAASHIRWLPIL